MERSKKRANRIPLDGVLFVLFLLSACVSTSLFREYRRVRSVISYEPH